MNIERPWARTQRLLASLALGVGVIAALPAVAQSNSVHIWTGMNPGSFAASPESAKEQCLNHVRRLNNPALTTASCDQFAQMISNGTCDVENVRDEHRHSSMSRRVNDRAIVQGSTLKRHGSNTSALLCDLGGGLKGYFYTGTDLHCNNVAFDLPPRKTPPKEICQRVAIGNTVGGGTHQHLDGFSYQNGACGNPLHVRSYNFHVGSSLKSKGFVLLCKPVN